MTPIPFHCHDCEAPTMNKNGLCDEHQPTPITGRALMFPNEFEERYKVKHSDNGRTIKLSDLSQSE